MARQAIPLSPRPPAVLGRPADLRPETAARRSAWPVALVNMPFTSVRRPSLQLGTLAPIARSHGFPVDTFHLNADFAAAVGPTSYGFLCEHQAWPTGEWLFALDAFRGDAPDADRRLLDAFEDHHRATFEVNGITLDRLQEIRHHDVPSYLDSIMDDVDWAPYRVIGFTSTFQQNTASFALARRIKERHPGTVILFGGSNFEGPMGVEWVRAVPWIDFAVNGEADIAITSFLGALADGTDPLDVAGVIGRRRGAVVQAAPEPPFDRLDELPVPDYDEFFERATRLGLLGSSRNVAALPFESARGCWWGAKRHCTFCGLNGGAMSFRVKSAGRVEAELAALARRYRCVRLDAADNIMELSYLDDLLPRLAGGDTTYQLFYEVKANLSRPQIELLAAAGVHRMQPGIESLSSHVLGLMRKGVRAIQNVNLLRWGRYYGIDVNWNIIYGFPGETEVDQRDQAELCQHLLHLQPPTSCGRIAVHRFSPLFEDRARFPVDHLRPDDRLPYVYPADVRLEEVATSFSYEFPDALPDSAYVDLDKRADAWKQSWAADATRPDLRWWRSPGMVMIEDLRRPDEPGTYVFEDVLADLYLAASEQPVKAASLVDALGLPHPVAEVEAALDEFCTRGLMMRDGNLFLALALPATGGRVATSRDDPDDPPSP